MANSPQDEVVVQGFTLQRAATLAEAIGGGWTVEDVIMAALGRGLAEMELQYLG